MNRRLKEIDQDIDETRLEKEEGKMDQNKKIIKKGKIFKKNEKKRCKKNIKK